MDASTVMLEFIRHKAMSQVRSPGFHCSNLVAHCMRDRDKLVNDAKKYKSDVKKILSVTSQENTMGVEDIANMLQLRSPYDLYSGRDRAYYERVLARNAAMSLALDGIAGIVHKEGEGYSFYLKCTSNET